nr:hypothetical protein [Tanacetum cinerariifolium]
MVNKIFGIGVGPVHSRNKVNHPNQFVPQAVLLRIGKVNNPPARPQPVPTGKPKVFAPVLTDAEVEGIFDSGCSRSMTGNKERLNDFQVIQGKKVTFGGGEGRITGKRTILTSTLDFENVYYVKELQQFNLFSISQIYDKKNRVLFTETECLVLSKDFKLPDEINEYVKWHRRMGHVNYKNMNRLVNDNLVRGKQHKASYKAINAVSFIFKPLQLLHMDLIEHKDETYPILKDFINIIENQLNKKIKAIRCDNVRTACYVLIRVLVTSPHNKTSYALLTGNIPSGYIVGYSASNKAYRVYNVPNKRVKESINLRFLEDKHNVQGLGHEWYFDLDYLTDTLGYKHVQANQSAGTQGVITNLAGTQDADSDSDCDERVIIVPSYPSHNIQRSKPKNTSGDEVDDSPPDKEEMQQFKFQNVWVLVDLPAGKYAIGTKWILKNKRDTRGIVV